LLSLALLRPGHAFVVTKGGAFIRPLTIIWLQVSLRIRNACRLNRRNGVNERTGLNSPGRLIKSSRSDRSVPFCQFRPPR
jgi:hypothetical protein